MRILCLNPYLPPPMGGIEKEMLAVAAELVGLGHRVRVLASTARFPAGDNAQPEAVPPGIEVQAFPGRLRSALRGFAPSRAPLWVPGLRHAATGYAPELTLVFNIGWGPALRPVLRALAPGGPILYRTFFHPPGGRLARLKARYLLGTVAMADRCFVSTERERAQLEATGGIAPARIAVIPPGVAIHPEDPALVAELSARFALAGKTVVAHVGRLGPFKGTVDLIAILGEVRARSGLDVVLLLIGSNPEGAELERLAARLGVGEQVRFTGEIRDDRVLRALLGSAQVMALPSEYEAFGIAYIEALAAGVPCIGTDVGGVAEAIAGAGRLIPRFGDRGALADALVELLGDEQLRLELGRAGQARVLGSLTWRHTANRILELGEQARAARAAGGTSR